MSNAKRPHLEIDPTWEIHPATVKEWMDKNEEVYLLDVRRQKEWDVAHLDGAKLIPLDQLGQQVNTIEGWKDKRVVVHCHHGVRSMNATAFLRSRGFTNVHSMAGGIDAWSVLVDTAVGRY